jgi:protein-S-isoprenylcysteine O-methyltransferase Ste14
MARQGFKRWWTKLVSRPIERSTFVLFTSACLILLYWQRRPMTGMIWDVQNAAARAILLGLFGLGWLTVLVCTFFDQPLRSVRPATGDPLHAGQAVRAPAL